MGVTRLLLQWPFYTIQTNFLYFFAHNCKSKSSNIRNISLYPIRRLREFWLFLDYVCSFDSFFFQKLRYISLLWIGYPNQYFWHSGGPACLEHEKFVLSICSVNRKYFVLIYHLVTYLLSTNIFSWKGGIICIIREKNPLRQKWSRVDINFKATKLFCCILELLTSPLAGVFYSVINGLSFIASKSSSENLSNQNKHFWWY